MEKNKFLSSLSLSFKFAVRAYILLSCLGFGVAALMSYQHYGFNHDKTVQYYLGDPAEGEMAFKKPYSQLVGVSHVHTYTMPLVFFVMWILLQGSAAGERMKKIIVGGGSLSILIYNGAPYVVRNGWVDGAWLFSVGGVGLFLFYFWPAILVLRELGKKDNS